MEGIWSVLTLALLPALGNFSGGLLAEFLPTSRRGLNLALHAAAGIIMAVVAVELMPAALAALAGWALALAFGLGGLAYVLLERVVTRLTAAPGRLKEGRTAGGRQGMWMIYVAVSIDLFSDGLMIGAGSAVSSALALTLAAGQVLADVPEGYATIANMKSKATARGQRLLLSASFALPVLVAAALSYYLLRGADPVYQLGALAFTAGLLASAVIEDMLAEAHESAEDTQWSVLSFTGGFVLFTLVAAGVR